MVITNNKTEKPFKHVSITILIETEREAHMLRALTNETPALTEFINSTTYLERKGNYTEDEVAKFDSLWLNISV